MTDRHISSIALGRYCVFHKLKVWGNPAADTSISAMVPTAFACLVFLWHVGDCASASDLFTITSLLWWSVISDLWCYYYNSLKAQSIVIVVESLSHVRLFCSPIDCSLPGPTVNGISQGRILEWVTISFFRDLLVPGIEPTSPALARMIVNLWATREVPCPLFSHIFKLMLEVFLRHNATAC